jgi:amino acid transporter
MTASAPVSDDHGGMLRRELRFWEAIALSIAIMAPTAAMALNGTVPASLVSRAVPLAFIFATIGVIFVSWAFIRLTSNFSHAGSVLVGLAITVVFPGLTRNIGVCLAAREGLAREA